MMYVARERRRGGGFKLGCFFCRLSFMLTIRGTITVNRHVKYSGVIVIFFVSTFSFV